MSLAQRLGFAIAVVGLLAGCGGSIDCNELTPADEGAGCDFGGELCEVEACETEEGLDFDFECVGDTWEKIDDSCQ